ncbi:MAG: ABC transporter permease [Propionibacteriaceae bacterium]|jgi:simple sugar transport system permease protein|nr:ABC transporter permease [Propionibacteriaceae bacterium]
MSDVVTRDAGPAAGPGPGGAARRVFRRILHSRLTFPLVCLLLVLLLNVIVTTATTGSPGPFFQIALTNGTLNGPLITILNRSSELVILALGMTMTVSCSAGTDISVGAVMAFSGSVSIWLLGFGTLPQNDYHVKAYVVPYVVGLLVAVLVGALCGVWNGFLVSRLRIQPMVATLILFTGGRGLAKVFADGQIDKVDVASYKWLGNFIQDSSGKNIVPVPTAIFIAGGMVLVTALVLRYTPLGMNIQAVGINNKASRILGLKSARLILLAYVFCGVCAAIAGIIATSRIGGIDANNCGKLIELDAILAVALGGNSLAGGKFSLSGSVIGAITIQALTTVLYSINVSADQLPFYKAIVVVIIVVLQSPETRPMWERFKARWRRTAPSVTAGDAA